MDALRPSSSRCPSCCYRRDAGGHRVTCLGQPAWPAQARRRAAAAAVLALLVAWAFPGRSLRMSAGAPRTRTGSWRNLVAQGKHAAAHASAQLSSDSPVAAAFTAAAAGAAAGAVAMAMAVPGSAPAPSPAAALPGPRVTTVAVHRVAPAAAASLRASRIAVVRRGDSLSAIASRLQIPWQALWEANRHKVANPNLIYPGQVLHVPRRPEISSLLARYRARPWAPVALTARAGGDHEPDGDGDERAPARHGGTARFSGGGTLSCAGLEQLWMSAGGPPAVARTMAAIAMAESGGYQYAHNPSGASGYWQILGQVVGGNIYSPSVNAANAVAKYRAGGFSPWVTYTSGAYAGRC